MSQQAIRSLDLVGGHSLCVRREDSSASLELRSAGGRLLLAIEVTERGPVIRLEAASLEIVSSGDLSLCAESLRLRATNAIELESAGAIDVRAAGDLSLHGRQATLEASLGDAKVRANDDVRLEGERVRVNC